MLGTDRTCPECGYALAVRGADEPPAWLVGVVSVAAVVGTVLLVQLVVAVLNQRAGL